MIAYGTHEAEEFLVKGDHLDWVGLEDKTLEDGTVVLAKNQISRVWNVHKPSKLLKKDKMKCSTLIIFTIKKSTLICYTTRAGLAFS